MSRLFVPIMKTEQVDTSLPSSTRLLLQAGYIRQASSGGYAFLPMAQRVLHRLIGVIHSELMAIDAQESSLPTLQSYDLWTKSGRLSSMTNMFKLEQERLLLAPTHEEEMTRLMTTTIHSYKQLPLILFQTGSKFRREARSRGGLLRGKEFIMNDSYSFSTVNGVEEVYGLMSRVYERIFGRLDLNPIVKKGDAGDIGGSVES